MSCVIQIILTNNIKEKYSKRYHSVILHNPNQTHKSYIVQLNQTQKSIITKNFKCKMFWQKLL